VRERDARDEVGKGRAPCPRAGKGRKKGTQHHIPEERGRNPPGKNGSGKNEGAHFGLVAWEVGQGKGLIRKPSGNKGTVAMENFLGWGIRATGYEREGKNTNPSVSRKNQVKNCAMGKGHVTPKPATGARDMSKR